MEHEKATTFQQALADPAVHNAPFLFAVALSSSTKEKIGVHLSGIAIAVFAGLVNAIAVVKSIIDVSRVSGVSTSAGLRMRPSRLGMGRQWQRSSAPSSSGLFRPASSFPARYESVLFEVAAFELACWGHGLRYPQLCAAAMGLPNAITTSWSGARLRTTQITGTATDLGSALGRRKLILITYKFVIFIAGGVAGSAADKVLQLHALRVPAGITIVLRTWLVACCVTRQAPFG
jgi:hypothetical protein